ncbi:MAG: hypothetical protein Q8M16_05935, partial [Pirellulaceae bacterium]|nr:hypothetical protein [Pirellulaceae bacterium]
MKWTRHDYAMKTWIRRRPLGLAAGVLLALASVGCSPPPGSQPVKPVEEPPKAKAPATSAYGKALESVEKLKDKAADYNDRLEKLNDPFA